MPNRCYLSNISPLWPFARQQELLVAALPGWPKSCAVFRDEVEARKRRGFRPTSLTQRAELLRATSRRQAEDIYLATLGVFAWTQDDMMQSLTLAAARGATVHVLDAGLAVTPQADAAILHQAVVAFAAARKADKDRYPGKISAEKRSARALAGAESIREFWTLPSSEWPMDKVLAQANPKISRNTAILYLGKRKPQQDDHARHKAAAEKRAAIRAKKAEVQDQ